MHPTHFKQAYDKPLGAGDNPNTGDLPYVVARDPNTPGPVMLVSCWSPSEAELAEVVRTGKIFVAVMAHPEYRTQPPISLHGFNPFEYPTPNAYQVAPRTFAEEEAGKVAEAPKLTNKNQYGQEIGPTDEVPGRREDFEIKPEASGLGEQIFPESKGLEPAKEVRLDPRADDFEIEKAGKDFNVKARTFSEEVTGKKLAD